jgi:hypothetical protein
MSFGEIFSHYPSEAIAPGRIVARTEVARALFESQNSYVIYPELKNVFSGDDVVAALTALGDGRATIADLTRWLESRFSWAAVWRARVMVTWLLKHGLVQ